MNKKWTIIFALFTIFLLTIFVLAYSGIVATSLRHIPYYDEIGHFVLFGLFAYLGYRASNRKHFKFNNLSIPLVIFLAYIFAISEETLQLLSKNRTFSFGDMFFGLAGITFFYLLDTYFEKNHSR